MFKNMTVGARLMAGFICIALAGALVAGIGIFNMGSMNAHADLAYESDLLGVSYSKEANINLVSVGRATRNVLLARSEPERARFLENLQASRRLLRDNMDKARPRYQSEKSKALFAESARALAEYEVKLDEALKLAAGGTPESVQQAQEYVFSQVAPKANLADDKLSETARQKEIEAAATAKAAGEQYDTSSALMMALVACTLAGGVGLGIWITRGLTRQLGGEPAYAVQVAAAIAAGELAREIRTRPGDSGSLLAAMKAMRDSLVQIVSEVRTGTDTIAIASNQIASGNIDLSSRTEQQASSLEETASSMEELTSTVKQNSDNARQANALAQSASEVAVRGGRVVSQVMETMASINESSSRIEAIIGVIDGIAFQTNILALNAAVEAARAGEQGRGFAVVASEVRNLAQRSAAAAKEIKGLIDDSVERVGAGGKLVDQAGATMDEIVQSITRVTDIMVEIASASQEQTMGIDQINKAVAEMDEVTQQNAALVEEAAAAAGSMQDQAATLLQVVSIFKLAGAPQSPAVSLSPVRSVPARAVVAPPVLKAKPHPAKKRQAAVNGDDWEEF